MNSLLKISFLICVLYWVGTGVWFFWPESSPIIELPGSTVEPREVQARGKITITRSLVSSRDESAFIQRTLVRDECQGSCEIVDLAGGNLTLKIGTHLNLPRNHILPVTVEPGKWRAVFYLHWQDRLGRTHIEPLQELPITVTP